ncbi:hypothetical protein DUI87_16159 [Hirundo rustica rustica]|uniref:Uncharacterized protein n=1 Tax=Hirundo rustica rustica TaxID=333673 RepID=A0A3M0K0L2_HIRRU|nr:hypothetical protein DUI87_16159 [Hirundo rustica rustica]
MLMPKLLRDFDRRTTQPDAARYVLSPEFEDIIQPLPSKNNWTKILLKASTSPLNHTRRGWCGSLTLLPRAPLTTAAAAETCRTDHSLVGTLLLSGVDWEDEKHHGAAASTVLTCRYLSRGEEVIQPSNHLDGPPLDLLQQVRVLPVLETPVLDAALLVGSHESRVEGHNLLPGPAGRAALDAAQDMFGFLGKCTWLGHVQTLIHQHPQVLFRWPALDLSVPQPVLILEVALTQMPLLALGLGNLHEIPVGPLLALVQGPLDGIPSFRCGNHATQLGVILKFAEGALDPFVSLMKILNNTGPSTSL